MSRLDYYFKSLYKETETKKKKKMTLRNKT